LNVTVMSQSRCSPSFQGANDSDITPLDPLPTTHVLTTLQAAHPGVKTSPHFLGGYCSRAIWWRAP
jgi:hypothetical protein